MGLDLFWYAVPAEIVGKRQVDIDFAGDSAELLTAARAEWDLHDWMHQLYLEKGGDSRKFFNTPASVRLTRADLSRLANDAALGLVDMGWVDAERLLAICEAAFARGLAVIYRGWW